MENLPRPARSIRPVRAVRSAALYCRISEDVEETGLGVARQERDERALAERLGWPIGEVYVDNDVSAWQRRKVRESYERMMEHLRTGVRDAVIVYHIDRLYRRPRELEDLIDLCEGGRIAFSALEGEYDLSTPEGCFMARMMVSVANKSSADASRRQRRKMVEVAENGRPHGGRRPYGFAGHPEKGQPPGSGVIPFVSVVPHEAAVLREVCERLLAGESLRSVCSVLNGRGDLTPTGRMWVPTVLARALLRPRLVGIREHRGALYRASWEPILTEEQQLRLRALLRDPRRRTPGAPRRHLLSGILRCGKCGKRMINLSAVGRRKRTYVCPPPPRGCSGVAVVADTADEWVVDAVLAWSDGTALTPADDDLIAIDTLDADKAQLDELATAWAARAITMEEWLRARADIQARIDATMREIADRSDDQRLRHLLGSGERLRDWWGGASGDQRRAALTGVLDHIVVAPVGTGRTFKPERLRPVFRSTRGVDKS